MPDTINMDPENRHEKTKVLFIIYDLERGGAELRLLDLVRGFPKSIEVYIWVTSSFVSLRQEFLQAGAHVKLFPFDKIWVEPLKLYNFTRSFAKLRPDCINVFDFKGLLLASLCLLWFRFAHSCKIYFHCINSFSDWLETNRGRGETVGTEMVVSEKMPQYFICKIKLLKQHLRNELFKILLRKCSGCISNSQFSKDMFVKIVGMLPERVKLIYNGVDLDKFIHSSHARKRIRRSHNIDDSYIVIGTVGNFRPEKNYEFLLSAFKQLLEEFPMLKLLCVGGGTLLYEYRMMAQKNGIENAVIFPGYVDNVPDYMSAMDLFVLCSKWEG